MKYPHFIYCHKNISEVGRIIKYEVASKTATGFNLTNGERLVINQSHYGQDFEKVKAIVLRKLRKYRESTIAKLKQLEDAIAFVESQTVDSIEPETKMTSLTLPIATKSLQATMGKDSHSDTR